MSVREILLDGSIKTMNVEREAYDTHTVHWSMVHVLLSATRTTENSTKNDGAGSAMRWMNDTVVIFSNAVSLLRSCAACYLAGGMRPPYSLCKEVEEKKNSITFHCDATPYLLKFICIGL